MEVVNSSEHEEEQRDPPKSDTPKADGEGEEDDDEDEEEYEIEAILEAKRNTFGKVSFFLISVGKYRRFYLTTRPSFTAS